MNGRASSDSNLASRDSDRVGNWAIMASTGQMDSVEAREVHVGLPHSPSDHRSSIYTQDSHLQTPMAHNRSSTSSQAGVMYYDQSGYPQTVMATYDPTQVSSHMSSSSVGSRSSNVGSATSPMQGPYYAFPLSTSAQQAQMAGYPAPFSHYQPAAPIMDYTSSGYHVVRPMSGEVASVGGMIDSHLHGQSIPTPLSPHSQQDYGAGIEGGSVYYQQYHSQGSQYGSQQAFYHNTMPVSGTSTGAGGYPSIMTGMQGSYPQQQHPSTAPYGVYPAQYAADPYSSHQQEGGAAYFANARPGWNPSQQHWRPQYYSPPSLPSAPPTYRRTAKTGSNGRSKGLSNSTLPMRPGSNFVPARSSPGAAHADESINPTDLAANSPPDGGDMGNPGRGLRPHYHPQQGPRSDHVLWCGNVPSDASVDELWDFFCCLPPGEEREGDQDDLQVMVGQENHPAMSPHLGHGILSIFIIARCNCAFVNYASPRHLERAVSHFHGQSLRPIDTRCPKLVCRVRKKDDEAQAGVGGQRGRGIHVAWVKEQDRKMKQKNSSKRNSEDKQQQNTAAISTPLSSDIGVSSSEVSTGLPLSSSELNSSSSTLDEPNTTPEGTTKVEGKPHYSAASIDSSSGSISFTSTSSSLFRHPAFHERFFILKSLGIEDLDRSVETGLWATQPHNEQVLDQAFRNSESVFLIFSANQSGGFYGYARMAGEILSAEERQQLQQGSDGGTLSSDNSPKRGTTSRPDVIPEGDEEKSEGIATQDTLQTTLSSSLSSPEENGLTVGTVLSPLPLTPAKETASPPEVTSPENLTSPVPKEKNRDQTESSSRSHTLSPEVLLGNPSGTSTIVPTLTTTAPSGVVTSASPPPPSTPVLSTTVSDIVAMDENRVRRKDMMAESFANQNGGSVIPTLLSEASTLGPSDSMSYDPRVQHNLALRALIHNLRLEERESMIQAEKLEKSMDDSSRTGFNSNATQSNPPRAGSSDSFGKPFKIEWIKTSSLSFGNVRKLRNPWRDNRQVKVSRDGTELEPNTGRQLLKEWLRVEEGKTSLVKSGRHGDEEDEVDDA